MGLHGELPVCSVHDSLLRGDFSMATTSRRFPLIILALLLCAAAFPSLPPLAFDLPS